MTTTPSTRCLGLAVWLALCAGPSGSVAQQQLRAQAPSQPGLDAIFLPFAGSSTPGCAVAATVPGQPRLEDAYGMADLERGVPNTPSTIFEAGSVSKQFTAAAVVLLAQRGKLSLDDDIRRYLPEVPDFGGRTITVRELLNHTSGLRDWGVVAAMAGWPRGTRATTNAHVLDIVAHQRRLNFDPGTEWSYSNTNYNLAAILVQRVSGLSLAEYTRRELFQPLGMEHTSWRDDYTRVVPGRALAYELLNDTLRTSMPNENAYGNGGLLTTVGDLLLWNDELDTGRVLGSALPAALQREGMLAGGKPTGYGAGLFLGRYRGEREVSHTGASGGYRALLARYPERGASLAILCNQGEADAAALGHALADLLLGDGASKAAPSPADARPPRLTVERAELERLAGVYRDRGTAEPVRFQVSDGVLRTRGVALEPLSGTDFRGTSGPEFRLVFQPAPGGGGGRPKALGIMGRDTTVLDAVAPADTCAAHLADYAGDWYSPEAEATWTLAPEDGKLVARRRPDTRLELQPAYADAFTSTPGAVWVFDRDASGKVTGLGIWLQRARDMRFERVR